MKEILDMLARTVAAAIVCVAFVANPWSAEASEKGFYVGAAGGYNVPFDSDIGSDDADLESDWAGLGALGYAFANGLRLEGEFGYRENDVDSLSNHSGVSGDIDTTSFMTNLLYDFNEFNGLGWPVTPYVGVGVGAARVASSITATTPANRINDSDYGFAYQGILGASMALNRYLALTADYRFFHVPDVTLTNSAGNDLDSDYMTNQFMLGLRFTFAAGEPKAEPAPTPAAEPKPAPTPAPAAPKEEEFIVFFDFDSSALTPEARNILRSAADAAKKGNYTRIVLTGHADRAGPSDYNFGLSRRRADAVKAELVRLGVSSAEITTEAKGESEPLVPTADGVPEAQNRRVEILMR
jgi:outer membrane protein OmpA-like peptidoglycan-associated protein